MYEQAIRDLSPLLRGKRENALRYLRSVVMNDPDGVVRDFLKYANSKAWNYASQIFRANPRGVFLAIAKRRIGAGDERILQLIGYSSYIPQLREFWNLYDEVENYRMEGIGVSTDRFYRLLINEKVKEALEGIRKEAEKGRELNNLKKKVASIKDENLKWDKDKILKLIKDGNIEKARNLMEELQKKRECIETYRELAYECEKLKEMGIGLDVEKARKMFEEGHYEEALEHLKREVEKGKELKKIKKRFEKLKNLANEAGERIPDVLRYVKRGDLEKAKEIMDKIDEKELKKKAEIMKLRRRTESILKEIDYVKGVEELRNRLKTANNESELKKVIVDAEKLQNEVKEILTIWDDEEVREKMREGMEESRKVAVMKRGLANIEIKSGNELFMKKYSDWVNSVHGFVAGGRVYILVGGGDKKLHVYDEGGNELFVKEYSDWVRSVHGFVAGGRVYILVGGDDKKLHVYDERGNELFVKKYSGSVVSVHGFVAGGRVYILVGEGKYWEYGKLHVYDERGNELFVKKYSNWVRSVHGFVAGGRVYILVGGVDRKLHVYAGIDVEELLSLKHWAESMGIETNFYEIMKVAVSNAKMGMELAKKLMEKLREKRGRYEAMKEERVKVRAKVVVDFHGEIIKDKWSKGEIVVRNEGEINLEDVWIEVKSDAVEIRGIREIGDLRRGEERRIEVWMKSRDAGYVPVEMKIRYRNLLTDAGRENDLSGNVCKGEHREEIYKGGRNKSETCSSIFC